MAQFDYEAEAELFPTRRRVPGRDSFKYKRFPQAAQAVRFAIEDLPPQCLIGAFLEVLRADHLQNGPQRDGEYFISCLHQKALNNCKRQR